MTDTDPGTVLAQFLKTPHQPAYFFETTYTNDRLLYCLSRTELWKRIEGRQASEAIVIDYPDGIDIEVSVASFEFIEEVYHMQLFPFPWALHRAFGEICRRSRQPCLGTGFIDACSLEKLAARIANTLHQRELLPGFLQKPRQLAPQQERKEELNSSARRRKTIDAYLASIRIHGVHAGLPLHKQAICSVEKVGGVDPSAVFNRLHSGTRPDERKQWQ